MNLCISWPVDGDCDHVDEAGPDVAVEEERVEPAHGLPQQPSLVDIPQMNSNIN